MGMEDVSTSLLMLFEIWDPFSSADKKMFFLKKTIKNAYIE